MSNLLSTEAVQDGSFVKFLSIVVLAVATLAGLGMISFSTVNPAYHVPDIVSILVPSGLTYFIKAAGVADGSSIAINAVKAANNTVPLQSNGGH